MFVNTLEIDTPGGPDRIIEHPKWALVEAEIRALDGNKKDSMVLEGEDGSYMGIIGGSNNEYVVFGYLANEGSFLLAAGQGTGKIKHIPVCGDQRSFADFEVVTKDTVLDVAETFFEQGVCDKKYTWSEGSVVP